MVVRAGQTGVDVVRGRAIDENVVGCLDVEGFLDFGIGGDEEVDKRDDEEKKG